MSIKRKNIIYYSLGFLGVITFGYYGYILYKRKQNIEMEKEEGSTEIPETSTTPPTEPKERYAETAGTTHFNISEFHSKDGVEVPKKYRGNVQLLMEQLEVLQDALGADIKINSGYRSPSHNSAVGGVSSSQHLLGKAADIRTSSHTPSQIKNKIESLISQGKMKQGGVGLYPTFVHYDIRGYKSRW